MAATTDNPRVWFRRRKQANHHSPYVWHRGRLIGRSSRRYYCDGCGRTHFACDCDVSEQVPDACLRPAEMRPEPMCARAEKAWIAGR